MPAAFVLALMFATGALAASGLDVPGPEFRFIGETAADSTSDCIGDPRTPLCAVETYGACTARSDWPLCDLIGQPVTGATRLLRNSDPDEPFLSVYQVLGQQKLEASDIPPDRARGNRSWQAGDVALLVQWHECWADKQCLMGTGISPGLRAAEKCPPVRCRGHLSRLDPVVGPEPQTFVLRLTGDRWQIVDIRYRAGLPAAFWGR